MRSKLVAGNWKMNGNLASNQALLKSLIPLLKPLATARAAVCVPYPYIAQTEHVLRGSGIAWGAQDASEHEHGAYTGEVSAGMLADFGCRYVIVGHSERRALFGDTNEIVAQKYAAVLKAGLTPILCVGETLAERESGVMEQVIARQVEAVMAQSGATSLERAVVAYEPVWAIGTGKTATPDEAQAVHAFIRSRVAEQDICVADLLTILYGGSVKAANAPALFAMPDIDGGLIGGAALVAEEFAAICSAAN
ncbi:MAG: triose-phosphate isomerase [Betaproteobacteria bacterium]|nr:triose-phosphate isomerase [Betaproteobacteria bacterium]